MSRSEKAEATYQRILDVANSLFSEKGYNNTSIQDIITELKMSKGAVYHHFKSKKEILDALEIQLSEVNMAFLRNLVKNAQGRNAKEKLTHIFTVYLEKLHIPKHPELNKERLEAHLDPHMIVSDMKQGPKLGSFLAELFTEGMKDGSITTEDPAELSEIFFMLQGVWLSPLIFKRDYQDLRKKVIYLQKVMRNMGADFITDYLVDLFMSTYEKLGYIQK